jgi:hypothetical protein
MTAKKFLLFSMAYLMLTACTMGVTSQDVLTPEMSTPTLDDTPMPGPTGTEETASPLPAPLYHLSGESGSEQIWRVETDGTTQTQITDLSFPVNDFDISLATEQIAYLADSTISISGPLGQETHTIDTTKVAYDAIDSLAWSPDGTKLALGGKDGIWLYDPASDQLTQLIANPDDTHALRLRASDAWSHDGSTLLVRRLYASSDHLELALLSTGSGELITSDISSCEQFSWSRDSQSLYVFQFYASENCPEPGLRKWDVRSGEVNEVISSELNEGLLKARFFKAVQEGPDGQLYYFYGELDTAPAGYGEYITGDLSMYRSDLDGITGRVPLRSDPYSGKIDEVLWAPDMSLAIIVDESGGPSGEDGGTLVVLSAGDEPSLTLGSRGFNLRWGKSATLHAESVMPTLAPPSACADDLAAAAQAGLPEGAFEGVATVPLTVPSGWQPLWGVFSTGSLSITSSPPPRHFVAIYTCQEGNWRELARRDLGDPSSPSEGERDMPPDILHPDSVTQVHIEPSQVWLAVDGIFTPHSATFHLLSFDGAVLHGHVHNINSGAIPDGVGRLQDVNEDGVSDVVLDKSDSYVFSYASGVHTTHFQVFYWDDPNQRMQEAHLTYFDADQPQQMRDTVNQAVDMANAGLWKDALVKIAAARDLASSYPECDTLTLTWDYALIKLHANTLAEYVTVTQYPLLINVFYGDYEAAVDLMRAYTPDQIFATTSPLIDGTVATGYQDSLAHHLIKSANAALEVKPDLAEAYFLRGWGEYLLDPTSTLAHTDIAYAATLRPDDVFLAQCAAYLE